jgi:glycosyltransferase involved in cell wall biosynthesis
VAFNWLGAAYSWALERRAAPQVFLEFNNRFAKLIARHHRFASADAVYGFCGTAVTLFRIAKRQGKYCILEQMIAPVAEQVAQVRAQEKRWPDWAVSASNDWDERVWTPLEQEEWALADLVLAPSSYVRDCLQRAGVPAEKIRMVPYGINLPLATALKDPPKNRPLRVLHAGAIDLRKGAPDLLTAARAFHPEELELRMAGQIDVRPERLAKLPANIRLLGRVSREEMGSLYEWADVLVLASVCEGSATACYEALSHGVPVLVSRNAGAPIENGRGGIVLSDVTPDSIVRALRIFRANPEMVAELSAQAHGLRDSLSLEAYGRRLYSAFNTFN